MSAPLVYAEDLAAYLQRDLDRCTADLAVEGASGLVRAYCGWGLSRTVETMTLDGNNSRCLTLPTMHVNDVSEVRIDGEVADPVDYGWGVNGVLLRRQGWPCGQRNIAADVDHGFDPTPDELRIVTLSIAARLYTNPEGLQSKSSGDGSRAYGAELPDLEIRLVSGYRLI
jgi:hypothetical protein